jgi:hypothetical protein
VLDVVLHGVHTLRQASGGAFSFQIGIGDAFT